MVQEKDHGGFPHVHLLRLPCEFAGAMGGRGTVPIYLSLFISEVAHHPKSPASNQLVALQSRMLINESNDIMSEWGGGNKKKVAVRRLFS
jgi:hypothetical protein